ncbi:unnamed protein product [Caenorhabditis angaria]|uniref:Dynactin subunit 6 n=1 Tax=Caenorhabditis angaria TaxID=860376 RepID=A0A9P1MXQ0_9PELO|nr:unnamed protein product [Caenorhabditis angaria]
MTAEPENKIQIAESAVVCAEAQISGEVSIGDGCVIHPFAIFDAKNGPIIIGNNCLFEEYCVIRNCGDGEPMIIGDENAFHVESECFAKYVGNRNLIGCRARLDRACFVADDCHITPQCHVASRQTLEQNAVVVENGVIRYHEGNKNQILNGQLEVLRNLLPNYHHKYGKGKKTG